MKLEVLYYDNDRGGTAISVDGGEYVIVRTGRRLLLSDTSWEESDVDDCGPLTKIQELAIDEAQAAKAAETEPETEMSEIVLAHRKRRLQLESIHPQKRSRRLIRKLSADAVVVTSDLED